MEAVTEVAEVRPDTFEQQMATDAVQRDTDEIVIPRTAVRIADPERLSPRRVEHVRARLVELRQTVDDTYLEIGMLLRQVQRHQLYRQWEYETFEAYAESELRMRRRKAFYLMSVADAFDRLAITAEERRGITQSNAVAIAEATRDPETGMPVPISQERREELLEAARTQTTRELRQNLREDRGLPPVDVVACNFAVQPEQKIVIDEALEAVRRAAGAREDELSRGRLLELMAAEYLAGTAGIVVNRMSTTSNDTAELPEVPTLESAVQKVHDAINILNGLDPDGVVVLKVVQDVVGCVTCPNCHAPVALNEADEADDPEPAESPTLFRVVA